MRKAKVYVSSILAGTLCEIQKGSEYSFVYEESYEGPSVSLLLPVRIEPYLFDQFPPFFDGLLPEGMLLEALLKRAKIDRDDLFQQLVTVGEDMVGNVTVKEDL